MDILKLISDKDLLDFSQNLSITRNYMGDTFFPDRKTENLEAEFYRLADGLQLPTMALVHGFDTEAVIGSRKPIEKVSFEKMLIKEKINMSERVQLYLNTGVSQDAIIRYIFDDAAALAEAVKTRTEVAKMQALTTGKMTVSENNLDFEIDYKVPDEHRVEYTWNSTDVDALSDIQAMIDLGLASGKHLNTAVTSTAVLSQLRKNKYVQTAIYGTKGVGTFVSNAQLNTLMQDMFGFTIKVNDDLYKVQNADGSYTTKRYVEKPAFVLLETGANGSFGAGLWGVTPEEISAGPWTEKSQDQYITITKWETPDPVAVWTKASGVFVPAMADPTAEVIATVTYE